MIGSTGFSLLSLLSKQKGVRYKSRFRQTRKTDKRQLASDFKKKSHMRMMVPVETYRKEKNHR